MALKYPKGFSKMTLDEQESWLSRQRTKILDSLEEVSRKLATVRGGMKIQPQVEDVPGIDYDKVRK
jgi:hypothetical protein